MRNPPVQGQQAGAKALARHLPRPFLPLRVQRLVHHPRSLGRRLHHPVPEPPGENVQVVELAQAVLEHLHGTDRLRGLWHRLAQGFEQIAQPLPLDASPVRPRRVVRPLHLGQGREKGRLLALDRRRRHVPEAPRPACPHLAPVPLQRLEKVRREPLEPGRRQGPRILLATPRRHPLEEPLRGPPVARRKALRFLLHQGAHHLQVSRLPGLRHHLSQLTAIPAAQGVVELGPERTEPGTEPSKRHPEVVQRLAILGVFEPHRGGASLFHELERHDANPFPGFAAEPPFASHLHPPH